LIINYIDYSTNGTQRSPNKKGKRITFEKNNAINRWTKLTYRFVCKNMQAKIKLNFIKMLGIKNKNNRRKQARLNKSLSPEGKTTTKRRLKTLKSKMIDNNPNSISDDRVAYKPQGTISKSNVKGLPPRQKDSSRRK